MLGVICVYKNVHIRRFEEIYPLTSNKPKTHYTAKPLTIVTNNMSRLCASHYSLLRATEDMSDREYVGLA